MKVAQKLSVSLQDQDWNSFYDCFTPALKKLRNKEQFINFVNASSINDFQLIYDKVVLQNDTEAYAYYIFSGSYLFQPKIPAVHMVYEKGNWHIDGFASYFIETCAQKSRNSYSGCIVDSCNANTNYKCVSTRKTNCCDYNFDCPSTKPYCHNTVCYKEECLSNSDCPLSLPACSNGKCVECATNSDCKNREVCNSVNNNCVQCLSDNDCVRNGWYTENAYLGTKRDAPYCINNICSHCRTNNDCYKNERCTSYNQCVSSLY